MVRSSRACWGEVLHVRARKVRTLELCSKQPHPDRRNARPLRNCPVHLIPHCQQGCCLGHARFSERAFGPPLVRLALHGLQRRGSFLNSLSWKNNCSPAVNTNSAEQSLHFNTLSESIKGGFPN